MGRVRSTKGRQEHQHVFLLPARHTAGAHTALVLTTSAQQTLDPQPEPEATAIPKERRSQKPSVCLPRLQPLRCAEAISAPATHAAPSKQQQ